jgi:8-oxo-dGTP pyrophosphatase MutT (NUDIX family)
MLRTYWFVTRPELQGIKCVLTHGDQVLLVRHTYGHRDWDVPGGTPRRGEHPLQAARREMHEELGVWLDDLRELGELRASPYHARDTLHCFHAELDTPEVTIDAGEIAAAEWFPRGQLPAGVGRYVARIVALAR